MAVEKSSSGKSIFDRLNSLHKLLICFVIAIIVYLLIQIEHLDLLTHVMIGWDTFSLCMIVMSWITFSITTSQQIRELAKDTGFEPDYYFCYCFNFNLCQLPCCRAANCCKKRI